MAIVSPISADLVARSAVSFDALQAVGETVYWIEGKSNGDVLVAWSRSRGHRDVLPEGFQVASYVHEYGGGAYLVNERDVWFCNAHDQRIYRYREGLPPYPVTPVPDAPQALRYADLRLLPRAAKLVCVRERHERSAVHNELVTLPLDGSAEPQIIASGDDFYMSPAPSPDGRYLTWVSWNAPLMPWDGSWLWLAEVRADGTLGDRRLVAGGEDESVCQPQWDAQGTLHFVSDRSGWWNLYAWQDGTSTPVVSGPFELAAAPWEFGYRTYALRDNRITAIVQDGPEHHLAVWAQDGGSVEKVPLPYTSMKPYMSMVGEDVVLIASSPVSLTGVIKVTTEGVVEQLSGVGFALETDSLSRPERFTFPTRDGGEAHGLYYAPSAQLDRPPPLIVRAHPGPTWNWPMRLDLHVQYFTSRGFAVADIDYRGSTGYGRAYRLHLRGRWGEGDATDCADAANHLAEAGRAATDRIAIWGASAGGFTVLSALTAAHDFGGGIARSTVVDLRTWSQAAPKFQAHHATLLAGEDQRLAPSRPVLLIHGDGDPVTPLEQVRALTERSHGSARLMVIPGAGHSFRRPHDIERILAAELAHLRTVRRPRTGR